jgi:hypothetical protein
MWARDILERKKMLYILINLKEIKCTCEEVIKLILFHGAINEIC